MKNSSDKLFRAKTIKDDYVVYGKYHCVGKHHYILERKSFMVNEGEDLSIHKSFVFEVKKESVEQIIDIDVENNYRMYDGIGRNIKHTKVNT